MKQALIIAALCLSTAVQAKPRPPDAPQPPDPFDFALPEIPAIPLVPKLDLPEFEFELQMLARSGSRHQDG